MLEANLFFVFIERLNSSRLRYIVTGSVASIIYGEPRMTHDIDLVLELYTEDVLNFVSFFPPDQFYCPAMEVINTEIARQAKGHFNIIHHESGFKADVYPAGQDELHKWAMDNRRKISLEGADMWIAPPEYVIIRKLQFYKEGGSQKHLRDIQKMLELSDDIIDRRLVDQMVAEYELSEEWQSVKVY